MTRSERLTSFGQSRSPSSVDRFGVWLSARALRRELGSLAGKRLGDFGCGYHATFARSVLDEVASAVLVDVALAGDLKADRKVTAIEGQLPGGARRCRRTGRSMPSCSFRCSSTSRSRWTPCVSCGV